MSPNHPGPRVAECRHVLRLSQTEFARKLRVTQGTVSDWETRKTDHQLLQGVSRGTLRLIADLFLDSAPVFAWLETGKSKPALRPR